MRDSLVLLAVFAAGVGIAALGWCAGAALAEAPLREAPLGRVGPLLMPPPGECAPEAGCGEEAAFVADLLQALVGEGPLRPLPDLMPPPAFGPPPGPRFAALLPQGPAKGPAPHPGRP